MSSTRDHKEAGLRLKKRREELRLRYRDVVEASAEIARRRKNPEFNLALSRLADIENKGVVPTIYRLYSLCAIYRLDFVEVLDWYGVNLTELPGDSASVPVPATHLMNFHTLGHGTISLPLSLAAKAPEDVTLLVSGLIHKWGRLPIVLLNALEPQNLRFGWMGANDWSMYPLIPPGALLLIDDSRQKILTSGWTHEWERPIYFLESREGYVCGWCSVVGEHLVVESHPASSIQPRIYRYPGEIDLVGQVTGLAMRTVQVPPRRTRGEAPPAASQNR